MILTSNCLRWGNAASAQRRRIRHNSAQPQQNWQYGRLTKLRDRRGFTWKAEKYVSGNGADSFTRLLRDNSIRQKLSDSADNK